jgi:hypothetical protein
VGAGAVAAVVVTGAVVALDVVAAEGVSHSATPPWCEQVPERVAE